MYRIEVASGEETVFRTVEELATGIRNGLITPRSRIFHQASQKWLPIEFHPHYKKALDLVTGGAPMIDLGPPVRPPQPSVRRTPVPAPEPRRVEVAPRRPSPVPEPPRPAPEPAPPVGPILVAPAPVDPPAPAEPPADEIVLPKVGYPEVPPPLLVETAHPVARRRPSGRTPLMLAGLVIATLIGVYLGTVSPLPEAEVEALPAAEQVPPSGEAIPSDGKAAEPPPAAVSAAPAPAPAPPPPIAITRAPGAPISQAWSSSAGAMAPVTPRVTPAPAPPSERGAIAPPPTSVDIALPDLPSSDSVGVAAQAQRDSAAMRRILRAVGAPASQQGAR